jgi:hypothetical protein
MRKYRLSGWQLTGLVISVVWAVASAFYLYSGHLERAGEASYSTNRVCVSEERSRLPPDAFLPKEAFTKCSKEAQGTHDAWMQGKWMSVALIALAPAIAWLLVYGFSGLVRRTKGG